MKELITKVIVWRKLQSLSIVLIIYFMQAICIINNSINASLEKIAYNENYVICGRRYCCINYVSLPVYKKSRELFHQPTLMYNFLYSLTICLLHYYPRHVSSINIPIFRKKNCIHTASGIFALELSERSYINIRSTVLLRQYWSKSALISEVIPNEFC